MRDTDLVINWMCEALQEHPERSIVTTPDGEEDYDLRKLVDDASASQQLCDVEMEEEEWLELADEALGTAYESGMLS